MIIIINAVASNHDGADHISKIAGGCHLKWSYSKAQTWIQSILIKPFGIDVLILARRSSNISSSILSMFMKTIQLNHSFSKTRYRNTFCMQWWKNIMICDRVIFWHLSKTSWTTFSKWALLVATCRGLMSAALNLAKYNSQGATS